METENRCPVCGAVLPRTGQECPFCAEARRLVLRLAAEEPVRLCARCGALLSEDEAGEFCEKCGLAVTTSQPIWRREDRVSSWLRRMVEPSAPGVDLCPHCGRTVPLLAAFCPHCGGKIVRLAGGEAGPAAPPAAEVAASEHAGTVAAVEAVPAEPAGLAAEEPAVIESAAAPAAEEGAAGPAGEAAAVEEGIAAVEGPALAPAVEEAAPEPAGVPQPRRSIGEQIRAFFRGAPGPAGPHQRVPGPSFWQQVGGLCRALFQREQPRSTARTWLWALLGILLLGLLGMVVLWMQLLRSGGIVLLR